ncbi:MAG: hypothetical protein P4M09_03600 [Devosia sp.]|nr:hypothetical protein [Devosia sp.]
MTANPAIDEALPTRSGALATIGIPVGLALAGAVVRYGAYLSVAGGGTPQGFVSAMCVWDCYWYGDIVQHGYQAYPETLNFGGPAGIANWAFFPLYPLLISALQRVFATPAPVLGAIVSPLLALGTALLSRPLFAGDRRGYFLFAAMLLAGPFSFYSATLYSESLFLLLTVIAFTQLGRRNYVGAGLAGALLSATRAVGVFFVLAIAAEVVMELARRPPRGRDLLHRPDIVLGLLLAPLGLSAFMVWLYFTTGDALAFFHIQRGWDRERTGPAFALWAALTSPAGGVRDALWLGSAGVAGLVLCGVLAWRRELPAAIFCTLALVFALTNGVESLLRFVVGLAPLSIVLCRLLARWRWLFWLSLLVFLLLGFEGTRLWIEQRGALM